MTRTASTNRTDVVGYIRVSTGDQRVSGLGLDAQRASISDACVARGWTLTEIHEDAASGGSTSGRPGLAAALEQLGNGEAGGLVVAKLDRLSRSLADFARVMETSHREGWALVALDLGIDTSTPAGEMMASVVASVAQYERRLIGQRTSEALQAKKAQGVKLGRPRSIPDMTINRIMELRAAGVSYRALADHLNAEGVPTGQGGRWHAASLCRAVKSREAA